jgi:hypothetical protein
MGGAASSQGLVLDSRLGASPPVPFPTLSHARLTPGGGRDLESHGARSRGHAHGVQVLVYGYEHRGGALLRAQWRLRSRSRILPRTLVFQSY